MKTGNGLLAVIRRITQAAVANCNRIFPAIVECAHEPWSAAFVPFVPRFAVEEALELPVQIVMVEVLADNSLLGRGIVGA